jgi:hypothetical protein
MITDNDPTNSYQLLIEGGDTGRIWVEYRSLSVGIHSHLKMGQQWTVVTMHIDWIEHGSFSNPFI